MRTTQDDGGGWRPRHRTERGALTATRTSRAGRVLRAIVESARCAGRAALTGALTVSSVGALHALLAMSAALLPAPAVRTS
jgi:hypothetical protein